MGAQCTITRRRLVGAAGHQGEIGRSQRHLSHCLACQAEAVRYRKLDAALHALASAEVPAPRGLATAVERCIAGHTPVRQHLVIEHRRPAAAAALMGALLAAGGAAVVLRLLRARAVV